MTTKVEPYQSCTESNRIQIVKLFRLMKCYLRAGGLYVGTDLNGKKSKCCNILMALFCVFCTASAIFRATKFLLEYLNNMKSTKNAITPAAYLTFYIETVCLMLSLAFILAGRFKTFEDLFVERIVSCQTTDLREYYSKLTKASYVIISAMCSIHVGCDLWPLFTPDHLDAPFDVPYGPISIMLMIVISVVSFFGTFAFYAMAAVYSIISVCLYKEFQFFSGKFKNLYQGKTDLFEATFQELWDEHISLCELQQSADMIMKPFVTLTYLSTIPILCCMVFGLTRGHLGMEELVFVAGIFCLSLWQLCIVTLVAVMVNEKAHEPVQHIFGSKWSSLSEGTLQKVSLFVARLSSERIGYTVCGLFTIDKSAVLMLGGTVLTYVVVVLQVQPDSDVGCLTPDTLNLTHLCL